MTANNASKLTHVYNSLKCIYEARYEDVGKPQGESRDPEVSPLFPDSRFRRNDGRGRHPGESLRFTHIFTAGFIYTL